MRVMFLPLVLVPTLASAYAPPLRPAFAPHARARRCALQTAATTDADELSTLQDALAAVNALKPNDLDTTVIQGGTVAPRQTRGWKVSGLRTLEPSFTRLFNHDTWASYTGQQAIQRWFSISLSWPFSTVLRSVVPIAAIASAWAYFIAGLPRALLPRTSPVPMSLMGTALGLLLVFRTNNSYRRLSEARLLWSQVLTLTRELAQGVATALLYDRHVADRAHAHNGASRVARRLAAFAWELCAKLTGGAEASETDVLDALLPAEEARWLASQRSRPLLLLASLRRELHDQFRRGNLPTHLHRKLEEDVRQLDLVVGSMERLFSSPLPPTMSRHIVRCLQLWLVGFPFVLAGTMAPLSVAVWVFATAYAFIGIDEVGVQVEQPFEIVPMTSICNLVMRNLAETFVDAPPGVLDAP